MEQAPASHHDLSLLPRAALCGIFVYAAREGAVTYANQEYTVITGWDLPAIQGAVGAAFFERFHPDDRLVVRQHLAALGEGPIGQARDLTYRFRHRNGHWIWCAGRHVLSERAEDGLPLSIIGTVLDISGQKTLEHELTESQERLALAIEAGQIGIWDWDLINGTSTNDRRVHQQFDMDWGAPNDADLWFSRMHEEDIDRVKAAVADSIQGLREYHEHYRVRWRDGSIHHLMAKGMVIRDADGTALRLLGMNLDVTEQVELQQRVEQRQKMEAIGQLAGGIAHDFNNQLLAIRGNAELLRSHLTDPGLIRFIDAIMTAARRSGDLTQQLLNYARQGVTRQSRFDVVAVIHEVMGILEHSIDKRIRIRCDLREPRVLIQGDETNIQNALLNIALNARDAMPAGGELVFAADAVDLDGSATEDRVSDLPPGRYVRVAISDTGTGIPPALIDRIREPFFTTKAFGAGTGLGLSAADGVIQQHGGVLTIASAVGLGTTMTMYLPYPILDPDPAPVPESEGVAERQRLSILVIDDEVLLTELVEAMLIEDGHVVHCESNPLSGIAYFEANKASLDAVILDMTMPQMSGTDAFRCLRSIDPQIPLLIMSGHSPEGAVDRLTVNDAAAFLQKPFSMADLQIALQSLVRGRKPNQQGGIRQ